jgi:hypothetical protein
MTMSATPVIGQVVGRIFAAGLLAAGLALSACQKPAEPPARKAAPPPVEAEAAPAAAETPLNYAARTDSAEVALKLPAMLKTQPDLHARLYAEGVHDLRAFAEGAANERAEAEGDTPLPPYNRTIEWSVGADTAKLLSLSSLQSEYTGGAHGNAAYGSVLWDKALKRTIAPSALFTPGVDAAMQTAFCEALTAEKKSRLGEGYTEPGPESWTCPKWRDVSFVLAASSVGGKAGGLQFLIPPYVAGPYAEGTYEVTVPLSAFARYLKPAYADEFAGRPRATTTVQR